MVSRLTTRRSFLCHTGIFGFVCSRWFVLMLCGPAAGGSVTGAGPQVDVYIVETADNVLVIAECRHDIALRRADILAAGGDLAEEVCIAHGRQRIFECW